MLVAGLITKLMLTQQVVSNVALHVMISPALFGSVVSAEKRSSACRIVCISLPSSDDC